MLKECNDIQMWTSKRPKHIASNTILVRGHLGRDQIQIFNHYPSDKEKQHPV